MSTFDPSARPDRRRFLAASVASMAGSLWTPSVFNFSLGSFHAFGAQNDAAGQTGANAAGSTKPGGVGDADRVAFFLVGDTHYLADRMRPERMSPTSQAVTGRFVEWLNKLPGTEISKEAGGGQVTIPKGVIHAGDVIDTGDKQGPAEKVMQATEWKAFEDDWGLKGGDGRLRFPVYEVHGNHDSPHGSGLAVDAIKRRNKTRPGLVNVSENGMHYSWNWGPIHFINLGIVVGHEPKGERRRRYAPLDSLPFLRDDLAKNDPDRKRLLVLTHHVDVARYSVGCDKQAEFKSAEWDGCDVSDYHDLLKDRRVAAVMYGHTHVRNIFRWGGGRMPAESGIPTFNNDNSSHFNDKNQAFLYFEISEQELVCREFHTQDAWETGAWTPNAWRFRMTST